MMHRNLSRRAALATIGAAPLGLLGVAGRAETVGGHMATFVLVHGGWHGGWCWAGRPPS